MGINPNSKDFFKEVKQSLGQEKKEPIDTTPN